MPYTASLFSFVETRLFTRLVLEYLSDAEYAELQAALMADPEAGPVIPGSGGVRKLRWAASGRERPRQAWCIPGDLLPEAGARRHLDVDDLSEERGGGHSGAPVATDPGAGGRCLDRSATSARRFSTACAN